jgi:hypothetical protein
VAARLVFAPPKRGKSRVVPLAESVDKALNAHAGEWAPVPVTLPWKHPEGKPVTHHLVFTTRERGALNRNYFNRLVWKPALRAAGIPDTRDNGMHALRHFFASVVLDGGASIRDLADWLGHEDPGFTLRVYAHLLPKRRQAARCDRPSASVRTPLGSDATSGQLRPPNSTLTADMYRFSACTEAVATSMCSRTRADSGSPSSRSLSGGSITQSRARSEASCARATTS